MNIMIDKENSCPSISSDKARKAKNHSDDSKIKLEPNKLKTECLIINLSSLMAWTTCKFSYTLDKLSSQV
jgi:hypothetical protein